MPLAQTGKEGHLSFDMRNLGEVCSQDGVNLFLADFKIIKIHFKILGCSCFTDQERKGVVLDV